MPRDGRNRKLAPPRLGEKIMATATVGAARGVNVWRDVVAADSLEEVPRESGDLARSQGKTTATPAEPRSYVYFDVVYAARQHEEVTWKHPAGGKAKYLEEPARRSVLVAQEVVADAVQAALVRRFAG